MALMDEFQKERDAVKQKGWRARLAYFWDYHKWQVIAGATGLILLLYFLSSLAGQKNLLAQAAFLNALALEENTASTLAQQYLSHRGQDPRKTDLLIEDSLFVDPENWDPMGLAVSQKLFAHLAAGELDIIAAAQDNFTSYAENGTFLPLEEIWPGRIYTDGQDYAWNGTAMGLLAPQGSRLLAHYGFAQDKVYLGIPASCKNLEEAKALLLWLIEEE